MLRIWYGCGLAMSGVEAPREQKKTDVHVCASCMNTVVQSFNHYHEQIERLRREKAHLEGKMEALRREYEEQRQLLTEKIRSLEEKLKQHTGEQ